MQITTRQLESLQRQASNATARVKRIKAEAQELVNTATQTVEVGVAAFGMGLVNGRYSSPEVVGIPMDLAASGVLHVVGFLVDDGGSKHLHNMGDGALASYLSALGAGIGRKMLTESRASDAAVTPGA